MKLEDLEKARDLNREVNKLKALVAWRQNAFRGTASMEVFSSNGRTTIDLTYDEADAVIDRYEADLENQAREIGVEI